MNNNSKNIDELKEGANSINTLLDLTVAMLREEKMNEYAECFQELNKLKSILN